MRDNQAQYFITLELFRVHSLAIFFSAEKDNREMCIRTEQSFEQLGAGWRRWYQRRFVLICSLVFQECKTIVIFAFQDPPFWGFPTLSLVLTVNVQQILYGCPREMVSTWKLSCRAGLVLQNEVVRPSSAAPFYQCSKLGPLRRSWFC